MPADVVRSTRAGEAPSEPRGKARTEPGDWLVRCVFGDPFLPYVSPAWLTSSVVDLARRIDNERAFERMPMLGEALKGAGCLNQDCGIAVAAPSRMSVVAGSWI